MDSTLTPKCTGIKMQNWLLKQSIEQRRLNSTRLKIHAMQSTIQPKIQLRETTPDDDAVIAQQFYQMWRDLDVPADSIADDWQPHILAYLADARQALNYKGFAAECDRQMVGSVSCQLFAGLYPNILKPDYRQYGYIWGVYVEADFRRQGIAKTLTQRAIAHLKAIGCTRAVLNASPLGQPLYQQLGFLLGNAMYLDL